MLSNVRGTPSITDFSFASIFALYRIDRNSTVNREKRSVGRRNSFAVRAHIYGLVATCWCAGVQLGAVGSPDSVASQTEHVI